MAPPDRAAEPTLRQVLDGKGRVVDKSLDPGIEPETLRRLYRAMLQIRRLDERLLRFQRQGRIGFYMTSTGEEAAQVGAAWACAPEDWIFPSYREPAVALWRGLPLRDFLCQLLGNSDDPCRGRQMPVHHSARDIHFVSISSPVGTQIGQAAGAAWAARLRKDRVAAITFFGDGATSTGDFHAGLNFAGVYKLPCVFFCRNNGWAISVPIEAQTASRTIAEKAIAYGFPGVRVDGNDVLAVAAVTCAAMERARAGEGPTLVEAVTFRRGTHSSSDDGGYRDPEQIKLWERRDPMRRYQAYLAGRKLWTEAWETELIEELDAEILATMKDAERRPAKPPVASLFEDVYAEPPWHLREQQASFLAHLGRRDPGGQER